MIVLLGAQPVFVDIEPDTCNIDCAADRSARSRRARAPSCRCACTARCADMDEINAIAARHGGIAVIEDAAQSFGATIQAARKSCNLSTIGCTSFFPSKPLGCYGDGGAIFTNDDGAGAGVPRDPRARPERALLPHARRRRRAHGHAAVRDRAGQARALRVGVAARAREIGARYHRAAGRRRRGSDACRAAGPRLRLGPVHRAGRRPRARCRPRCKRSGIPTAVHYPMPLHQQPAYARLCGADARPPASRSRARG